jgi:sulfur carrier protein
MKENTLNLIINATPYTVPLLPLPELLEHLGHEIRFCAVAINETVVPRSEWTAVALKEGDRIEIVSPRQGG